MKTVGLTMSMDAQNYYIRQRYIQYMTQFCSNVMPIILPITDSIDLIREYAREIDGLILTGGDDIDPELYGERKEKACGVVHRLRDEFEIALTRETTLTGKPVLGICRGMQVINVTLGGTLWQDIDVTNHADTFCSVSTHEVRLGGRMREIIGCDTILTNSYHHQSVKSLGMGLTAVANSLDGNIEAVYGEDYPFLCGVQWHPEMDRDECSVKIIRAFGDAL